MAEPVRVTICTLTYQRPAGLARLLQGLALLEFTDDPPRVKVLVVDNNPDGSAATICDDWRDRFPFPISCVHDPRPGIPRVRNTALDIAATDTDWIAFIDDDEVPTSRWLERLLSGQQTYQADVVTGPVVPHFAVDPPEEAYTNNVMFRAGLVRELALRFDERLANGVGEDTHFFRRIDLAGYSIVWVDDALVEEWIEPARVSERWLIERRYLHAVTNVLIARDLAPGLGTTLRRVGAAARRGLVGSAMLAVGRFTPQHVRVSAKRRLAYALGSFEALLDDGAPNGWVQRALRAGLRRLTKGSDGSS
jgi:glycosyltransferase involved in cell wall biosynthesis